MTVKSDDEKIGRLELNANMTDGSTIFSCPVNDTLGFWPLGWSVSMDQHCAKPSVMGSRQLRNQLIICY